MIISFFGHREVFDIDLRDKIYSNADSLIKKGASQFLLGGYGEFDNLSAIVIKDLKKIYSNITSIIVLPYINKKFNNELYDYSIYPPIENVPLKFAIVKRNEYMVNMSDIVISYVNRSFGGAYKTIEYAKRKNKRIINLGSL